MKTSEKTEVTTTNTLPTFYYPEDRYFVDYCIKQELPRWVRIPMMTSKDMEKLFSHLLKNELILNLRFNLEEDLDKESFGYDEDGKLKGLGYTKRTTLFDKHQQECHEYFMTEITFEEYSNIMKI
jgi:hypothetical protein